MKTRHMFDYAKTVLESVSFDPKLFYKELEKAIGSLLPYDMEQLVQWLNSFVQEKPELRDCLVLIDK